MQCRVCHSKATSLIFHSAPRSVISIRRPTDAALDVFVCNNCGHCQSGDIDFKKFYDSDYRFQLSSDEHDELHAIVDNEKIFRTDLQARIALEMVKFPRDGRILDYGAAKATTLRKICNKRLDLVPHVFDVSEDYRSLWKEWIPLENQASYDTPKSWQGTFDTVTANFVLEHVEQPNQIVANISALLKQDGHLFLLVPNPVENYSDYVVTEHVNHFTKSSLEYLLNANLADDFWTIRK